MLWSYNKELEYSGVRFKVVMKQKGYSHVDGVVLSW